MTPKTIENGSSERDDESYDHCHHHEILKINQHIEEIQDGVVDLDGYGPGPDEAKVVDKEEE